MKPLFASSTALQAQAEVQRANVPAVVTPDTTTALVVVTDDHINQLIADGGKYASAYANTNQMILANVRASDVDVLGDALNDIVTTAKKLNPTELESSKGVFGKVRNLFGNAKERMCREFSTVEQRINQLVDQCDQNVEVFRRRVVEADQLFASTEQAHNGFVECERRCGELIPHLRNQAEQLQLLTATDSFAAQRYSDVQARITQLEKRADDYMRMQQATKLLAASIRLNQTNARELTEKFTELKTTVVPLYIGIFSNYIAALDNKRGAELASSIHDATDAALRAQADMLRQSTVETTKAVQRSVVGTDALLHVQTQLIGTIQDVRRITAEGKQQRDQDRSKLEHGEAELIKQLTSST